MAAPWRILPFLDPTVQNNWKGSHCKEYSIYDIVLFFLQCASLFFQHNSTKLTQLIRNGNLETNLNWRAEDTALITV